MNAGEAVPILGRQGDPCTLVIFGASGDLTRRKLLPAIYNLTRHRLLPETFAVVGVARRETSSQEFRRAMRAALGDYAGDDFDQGRWDWLEGRLHFVVGDFDDGATFTRLAAELERLGPAGGGTGAGGNALFYLSTAPDYFGPIAEGLCAAGLTAESDGRWRRVIVEKPFGHDLDSARELNARLHACLDERQIFRIDHYLGKETVQNLLAFRFANGIFEPIWNRRYVDHVQITVAEALGVEDRGGYYDRAGALRDMVPNHIFQLISLVGMEPPVSFEADAVRDEQCKLLRAVAPMSEEDVLTRAVRGQYGAGEVGGRAFPDYRSEPRVDPRSKTETYVALELAVDNWRWKDVPFYLRVGKALPRRRTEIVVVFNRPPFALFRDTEMDSLHRNLLVIDVQPDEGISLQFGVKVPGETMRIGTVAMDFRYDEHFGSLDAVGYERLLFDAMGGDATLFQREDMVEVSWRIVEPILDLWQALPARGFPNYAAGSWGPPEADELLARSGRRWHEPRR